MKRGTKIQEGKVTCCRPRGHESNASLDHRDPDPSSTNYCFRLCAEDQTLASRACRWGEKEAKVPRGKSARRAQSLGAQSGKCGTRQRMLKCKQQRILCLPPPRRSQECKHAAASSPTVQFVSSDVSSNPLTPHLIFLLTKSYRQKRPLLLPVA